jgi:hypothetical protein
MTCEYYAEEIQLFKHFGLEYYWERFYAYEAFKSLALHCFLANLAGPEVEKVRTIVGLFQDCKVTRGSDGYMKLLRGEPYTTDELLEVVNDSLVQ